MTRPLHPAPALRGSVRVPGDKSISHRAVIINSLAKGEARITGFARAKDTLASVAAMQAFGVGSDFQNDGLLHLRSPGRAALRPPSDPIDCGNSGTTMRLVAGIAAGLNGRTVLDGDGSLRRRPMDRVLKPLAAMGAQVEGRATEGKAGRLAPITIDGGVLQPFRGRIDVASAQVKSAVLLAALAADGPSELEEIAPTRDHSEIMLRAMGAALQSDGLRLRLDPAASSLSPVDVDVPGDISAAVFWLVAASVRPDSEIELPGVGLNPTRTGALDVLQAMGADIEVSALRTVAGEVVGDLRVRSTPLTGTEIAGDVIPRAIDELPALAVAAAYAQGPTEIRAAAELRVKESDRIATTTAGLRALGAGVQERPDGLRIDGGGGLRGARLDSYGDHRLAMALAVAALGASSESELTGDDAVAVSYPAFWEDLERLSGQSAG